MFCRYCGRQIDDGSRFCIHCGRQLSETVAMERPRQQPPQKQGMGQGAKIGVAAAVVAVLVIAIAAIVAFALPKQNDVTHDSTAPYDAPSDSQGSAREKGDSGVIVTHEGSDFSRGATDGGSDGKTEDQEKDKGSAQGASSESEPPKTGNGTGDTVTLSVETADGSTLTGTVHRDGSGFVIADSVSREYSIGELKALNLTDAELCIAWNEPFARQGYHFKNPGLRAYFQACDWYVDRGNASGLTGAGAVNNERLRQIAEENASSRRWKYLAAS